MKKLFMYIMFVSMMSHGLWASLLQIEQRPVDEKVQEPANKELAKRLAQDATARVAKEEQLEVAGQEELARRENVKIEMKNALQREVNSVQGLSQQERDVLQTFNEKYVEAIHGGNQQQALLELQSLANSNANLFEKPEVARIYEVRSQAVAGVLKPHEKRQVLSTMRQSGYPHQEVSFAEKFLEGAGTVGKALFKGVKFITVFIVKAIITIIALSIFIALGAVSLALTIVGLPFRIMGLNRGDTMFGRYLEGASQALSGDTGGIEMRRF